MAGIRTTAGRLRMSVNLTRPIHRFVKGVCRDCDATAPAFDKQLRPVPCPAAPKAS